jgi:hypothetical protein
MRFDRNRLNMIFVGGMFAAVRLVRPERFPSGTQHQRMRVYWNGQSGGAFQRQSLLKRTSGICVGAGRASGCEWTSRRGGLWAAEANVRAYWLTFPALDDLLAESGSQGGTNP